MPAEPNVPFLPGVIELSCPKPHDPLSKNRRHGRGEDIRNYKIRPDIVIPKNKK